MIMRFILGSILVLIVAGFGLFGYQSYNARYGGDSYGAPFELVDQDSQKITQDAFVGHPSTVFFGFTHCPEVCPTTLFELDGWLKQLGAKGEAIRAYFVSVDPERDTPEILKTYVGNFSDRITGISGDPARVHAMLKAYGIYFRRVDEEDGDYTMDHTASILLLDSQGKLAGTIAYGENPDTALAKLERLAGK